VEGSINIFNNIPGISPLFLKKISTPFDGFVDIYE
jgi:hypothetical protein